MYEPTNWEEHKTDPVKMKKKMTKKLADLLENFEEVTDEMEQFFKELGNGEFDWAPEKEE